MRALNRNSGRELARDLSIAETLCSRTRGLIGRRTLAAGEGLLIRPCKGVHTFLMKFPIDVVFLDGENRIMDTVVDLQPQRMTKLLLRCQSVLELPAGTVASSATLVGNEIIFE